MIGQLGTISYEKCITYLKNLNKILNFNRMIKWFIIFCNKLNIIGKYYNIISYSEICQTLL